jgi:hypothetical protein
MVRHDARVQGIEVKALEADERHGYAGRSASPVQGKRNEELLALLAAVPASLVQQL